MHPDRPVTHLIRHDRMFRQDVPKEGRAPVVAFRLPLVRAASLTACLHDREQCAHASLTAGIGRCGAERGCCRLLSAALRRQFKLVGLACLTRARSGIHVLIDATRRRAQDAVAKGSSE